ncbi:hypothetical protein H6F61_11845 [Cyanobacteria bacterium FACHB-472]|nr:hypothetical protein [Cyanobacteria bacterium FACHB-472]
MTQDIKTAIQHRIQLNHSSGVQFMEGQLLPHGITLETACTLAEYGARGMNDEAVTLISTLPQREVIQRIYCACAGIEK